MMIIIIIITWLHFSTSSTFQGQRFNFRWTENAIRWNNFVTFHLRNPIASVQNYPVSSSKRTFILSNLIIRLILTTRSRSTFLNTTISAHFNLLSPLLVKTEVSIPWGTVQSNNNLTITQLLPRRWALSEALTAVQLLNIHRPLRTRKVNTTFTTAGQWTLRWTSTFTSSIRIYLLGKPSNR